MDVGEVPVRAVIFVRQDGPDPAKQETVVLRHCDRQGYEAHSLCFHAVDCAALVATGAAEVVVAAYGSPDDELARAVWQAGGRVEYVHTPARRRLDLAALIRRWRRGGRTVGEIADLLDTNTGEIRTWLPDESPDQ